MGVEVDLRVHQRRTDASGLTCGADPEQLTREQLRLMVGDRREIEGSPQTGDFQPPAAEQELQAMEQWLASYGDTSIGGSVLCSLDRILGASADSNPADAGAKRQRMDRYVRALDRDA